MSGLSPHAAIPTVACTGDSAAYAASPVIISHTTIPKLNTLLIHVSVTVSGSPAMICAQTTNQLLMITTPTYLYLGVYTYSIHTRQSDPIIHVFICQIMKIIVYQSVLMENDGSGSIKPKVMQDNNEILFI
ncbi:hypothetical protein Hanom_Chr06g00528611 [Helianthus anomalus]